MGKLRISMRKKEENENRNEQRSLNPYSKTCCSCVSNINICKIVRKSKGYFSNERNGNYENRVSACVMISSDNQGSTVPRLSAILHSNQTLIKETV